MVMFSIGIPAYKSKFLRECIESILSQTYTNFELIIVNDCSPDNIEEIVLSYKDERIRYYRNDKNIGAENVVINWNKCLEKARGEYFILMGDDDKMDIDYLEEFIRLIQQYPDLDIYHCRSKIINEHSVVFGITPINPPYEDVYDYIMNCLQNRRQQYISDFVYRTGELQRRGGFYNLPLGWTADYVSSYIACGSKGIAHTNKPVFNYRLNQYNITALGNLEIKWRAYQKMYNWVNTFLLIDPADDISLIKHQIVSNAASMAKQTSKYSFIRQYIGQGNFFINLFKCWLRRKEFQISSKDFLGAFFNAINDKLEANALTYVKGYH